jgi:hypothetical protein
VSLTLGRSLPRDDEHEFRLDAGNQTKIPITMQKRHAAKNSVRRYQAVIRGTWSHAPPIDIARTNALRCALLPGCRARSPLAARRAPDPSE